MAPSASEKASLNSAVRLEWIKRLSILFISQRFNWRKLGGAARRVKAGDEADGRGDREADEGHERARACGQRRDPGDQARDEHPGGRPHNSAEQTERYRLGPKLQQHVAVARPHRFA